MINLLTFIVSVQNISYSYYYILSFKHQGKLSTFSNALTRTGNFEQKFVQFRFSKSRYRYTDAIIAEREIARSVYNGCPSTMFMIHSKLSRSVVRACNFSLTENPIAGPVNNDYCSNTCNELAFAIRTHVRRIAKQLLRLIGFHQRR